MNAKLYIDDKGTYIFTILGCKVYGDYTPATGVFKCEHGSIFGASAVTASLQGIDVKSAVHNGQKSMMHIEYHQAASFPGGHKGLVQVMATGCPSFWAIKDLCSSGSVTGFTDAGKVILKHKPTGAKQTFASFDEAWDWANAQQSAGWPAFAAV